MRTHELRIWPSYFAAIVAGEKTFETRFNDRDFAVGDVLKLREFDPTPTRPVYSFAPVGVPDCVGYTERSITADVVYVLHGGQLGIKRGWCVLGIRVVGMPTVEPA